MTPKGTVFEYMHLFIVSRDPSQVSQVFLKESKDRSQGSCFRLLNPLKAASTSGSMSEIQS